MNDIEAFMLLAEIPDLRIKNLLFEQILICMLTLQLQHLTIKGDDAKIRTRMLAAALRHQMLDGLPAGENETPEQHRHRVSHFIYSFRGIENETSHFNLYSSV